MYIIRSANSFLERMIFITKSKSSNFPGEHCIPMTKMNLGKSYLLHLYNLHEIFYVYMNKTKLYCQKIHL